MEIEGLKEEIKELNKEKEFVSIEKINQTWMDNKDNLEKES